MTSRNLLIIAAVPGFRSNTKLEREDNNPPTTKQVVLDLYAALKLGEPPVQQRKNAALPELAAPYGKPPKREPVKVSDVVKRAAESLAKPSAIMEALSKPPKRVSTTDQIRDHYIRRDAERALELQQRFGLGDERKDQAYFEREYLTATAPQPRDGDLDMHIDKVYWKGHWYSRHEAMTRLSPGDFEHLRSIMRPKTPAPSKKFYG